MAKEDKNLKGTKNYPSKSDSMTKAYDMQDVGVTEILTDPLASESYDSIEATKLMEEFWKAYYDKTKWDEKFDMEESFYIGDREIGNIYTDSADKDARTVFKLMFMLSEAEIDLNIPEAIFKAVDEADEEAIKQLQSECDYTLRAADVDKINSYAERECKKYGTIIYKVLWNPNFVGAGFRGRVEIVKIHPKNILIAPGTTDIDKCDVIYHVENVTLGRCIRQYGEIAKLLIGHGQPALSYWDDLGKKTLRNVNKTIDVDPNPNIYMHGANHPLNKFVIVERWYIDDEGDVGVQIFSGRLILSRMPKFYYRRKTDPATGELIYDKNGNTIPEDIELVPYDYKTWVSVQSPDVETKPEGVIKIWKDTQLKRYIPKELPFVFQYNIPRSKCPWGISNSEILWDSEQSMKKMWMKHEERMLNGTTKIAYQKETEEEAALLINNADQQLLPMNDPAGGIREVNLLANDAMVLQTFQLLRDLAQHQVGITNVQRGFNENDATSGKMVEALIQQSSQTLGIKANEKHIAYKKIYKLVCDFLLCFSDGTRPYRIDTGVKPVYGKFNRYDLLKWNTETEEWIYPDIDIDISAEQPFPRGSVAMYNNTIQLAAGGFFNPVPANLMVWKLLSKLRFPNADMVLEGLQEQLGQAQAAEQAAVAGQQQGGTPPAGGETLPPAAPSPAEPTPGGGAGGAPAVAASPEGQPAPAPEAGAAAAVDEQGMHQGTPMQQQPMQQQPQQSQQPQQQPAPQQGAVPPEVQQALNPQQQGGQPQAGQIGTEGETGNEVLTKEQVLAILQILPPMIREHFLSLDPAQQEAIMQGEGANTQEVVNE
jgi:hypothetical protein